MKESDFPIFSEAVRDFWRTRARQGEDQRLRGVQDQGARSTVTGGKQMDGFIRTLATRMVAVGVAESWIYAGRRRSELPGYFRPTKEWDIVVVRNGHLLAAIELKSQIGPSFGNNFNNRTEEAMGSALDIWTAFREGAFGDSPAPWLGYLFLLELCDRSQEPIKVREPHFKVFPEFREISYARRYEIFCRKLVRERQYSGSCFLVAQKDDAEDVRNYMEPAEDLSARRFMEGLLRHVAQR